MLVRWLQSIKTSVLDSAAWLVILLMNAVFDDGKGALLLVRMCRFVHENYLNTCLLMPYAPFAFANRVFLSQRPQQRSKQQLDTMDRYVLGYRVICCYI